MPAGVAPSRTGRAGGGLIHDMMPGPHKSTTARTQCPDESRSPRWGLFPMCVFLSPRPSTLGVRTSFLLMGLVNRRRRTQWIDRSSMTGRSTTMRAYPSAEDSRLLYGNENRRSQSQGSAGSKRFRLLQSPARTIPRRCSRGSGTRPWDIAGAVLMGPGFVAGATPPGHEPPERLPCRLPAVCLTAIQASIPQDVSIAVVGIHRDGAKRLCDVASGVCS
jgi:hypothetical protein